MLITPPSKLHLSTKIQCSERRLHFYGKGEEIPLLTQGVWNISSGFVQLVAMNNQGDETWLGWASQGNFFGLWLTSLDSFKAKALSDVYLQWYSLEEVGKSSSIAQNMLAQTVIRVQQTERLLAIAGLKRVEEKLIALLHLLAESIGEKMSNDYSRITVRFTHQNLASAIGTTRVTVTRLLGELQKDGLICIDKNRHIIIKT
ncbi:Crp/Fnr family transcriptional regulator [Cyanobacterium stanieri LEGE 03274]|uniref:Crp/Fnr family transcriptional regulator n=2 Tax=Cyanobacterium TaxID=102234 RepID=A0ABR9V569_9CHRO|nr:Crp/Fnr family transcriptional regulator [Cyanobacterium stanieri]MBE9223032.1 Crp/Fnr family transcriptional regulator [Cyanobacterium stanieri LEGE 03274]